MATITSLGANDSGATSRGVINTNFTNLNSDKIETSVLDTDGTLAANSDSKVATQKAAKTYVDTELAAVVAGGTALTLVPYPNGAPPATINSFTISGNTTGYLGQYIIPFRITVNKISFRTTTATTPDTFDITCYSEDGQTQMFSVTTATVTANAVITTSVPSITLEPGIYWIMINANSTVSVIVMDYEFATAPFSTTEGLLEDVASEPIIRGTLAISAGTPPSTITPTGITGADEAQVIFRLDN